MRAAAIVAAAVLLAACDAEPAPEAPAETRRTANSLPRCTAVSTAAPSPITDCSGHAHAFADTRAYRDHRPNSKAVANSNRNVDSHANTATDSHAHRDTVTDAGVNRHSHSRLPQPTPALGPEIQAAASIGVLRALSGGGR